LRASLRERKRVAAGPQPAGFAGNAARLRPVAIKRFPI